MSYEWINEDFDRFYSAIDQLNFGSIDRDMVILNSLQNAEDVAEEDDPVGCAITTAKMYLDGSLDRDWEYD